MKRSMEAKSPLYPIIQLTRASFAVMMIKPLIISNATRRVNLEKSESCIDEVIKKQHSEKCSQYFFLDDDLPQAIGGMRSQAFCNAGNNCEGKITAQCVDDYYTMTGREKDDVDDDDDDVNVATQHNTQQPKADI
jgi:hypothetical protein